MTDPLAVVLSNVKSVADAGPLTLILPLALLVVLLAWAWLRGRPSK